MDKKRAFSLVSRGLKYKLRISFYLMSILPLLVCIYIISSYILPQVGLKLDIVAVVLISIVIAVIGFWVVKEIFDRILSVSSEARLIAAGDISRKVKVVRKDEVSYLGEALNQLTQRIRDHMDELRSYSERTTEINFEIQKRVLVLSSLLQISSLISQGTNLEDVLKITTEKSRLLAKSDVSYFLFREEGAKEFQMSSAEGTNAQQLLKIKLDARESIFDRLVKTDQPLIVDKENVVLGKPASDFYEKFRLKNTLALPVYLRGRLAGILGLGNNREGFLYEKDDIALLDIFVKQIAIALENDLLMRRLDQLEIKDALTGLYNQGFIISCLHEEIDRAIMYRRPCAFILFNIDDFQEFHQNFGSLQAETALKKAASLIKDSVTKIDHVARFSDTEFAVVLPEKNKRQAQEIAEEIRKKIEFTFSEEKDTKKRLTLSGGVSENPLDGVEAKELIAQAQKFLKCAQARGKNRIAGSTKKSK